jgi:predicted transcriptional regulator
MTDPSRCLLLSVKPRYAEAILDGRKTVELRRTRPRIEVPTTALIYSSSPERALVGTCDVTEVVSYTPLGLWRLLGSLSAVSYEEFRAYFTGCDMAYGLMLANVHPLSRAVALPDLRRRWQGFQPPQSFRYLSRSLSDEVLALAT